MNSARLVELIVLCEMKEASRALFMCQPNELSVSICTSETNTITIELDSAEPCSQTRVHAPFGPGYEWPGHGRLARPARYTLANAPLQNTPNSDREQ
jgi:hypothetical protein